MIDEKATYEKFGYYSRDLKPQSGKKIVVVCDDCGKIRIIKKCDYRGLCISCAVKGERHPCFGKHLPEETRKKISDAHKCIYPSEETRRKLSDARKGKHPSEETRKKISDSRKGERHPLFGKHPSEEARKKMSDARKGEKHWNWKGGASFEPYCVKFNNEFKEKIRDKFGRVCFLCQKTEEENGARLSVHHVNYNKNCGCDDDKTCQFVPLCRGLQQQSK